MKYKTESFTDIAELYRWASEKKDIECNGKIYKYSDRGYDLFFKGDVYIYKKVIYIKTKKVEFWVNFYSDECLNVFDSEIQAKNNIHSSNYVKTEKFETEIEVSE